MKKLVSLTVAAVVAIALVAASASAQGKDPVLGTWILNVAKSKFDPAPGAKSGTRVYTAAAGGKYSLVADQVGADGKTQKTEFTAADDGKDYPYKGDANYNTISIKRIDANTVESTLKLNGKEVGKARRSVSADGKTMTITQSGASKNVTVWDKK